MAAASENGEAALPLLRAAGEGGSGKDAAAASCSCRWRLWAREAGLVGYLALPMVVVSMSQYVVQVSSNMMVGHLPGVLPLSSAAIATSLANVTGFSLLVRRPCAPSSPPFSSASA
jgi:MATE family multidrug resistance protein